MGEKEIGRISHYYGNLSVAVVDLTGSLAVKEWVAIRGATTDFEQVVKSIQIDHRNIESAGKGQSIGLMVKSKARAGDRVYKLNGD